MEREHIMNEDTPVKEVIIEAACNYYMEGSHHFTQKEFQDEDKELYWGTFPVKGPSSKKDFEHIENNKPNYRFLPGDLWVKISRRLLYTVSMPRYSFTAVYHVPTMKFLPESRTVAARPVTVLRYTYCDIFHTV